MGVLRELGRLAGNLIELVVMSIGALIYAAICLVGVVIDLLTDILGWINDKIEELLDEGEQPKEVNVLDGNALSSFIREKQLRNEYTQISLNELNAMRNSVVNVVTDNNGRILDDQMIRSDTGFAENTRRQFNGQGMIKIPV